MGKSDGSEMKRKTWGIRLFEGDSDGATSGEKRHEKDNKLSGKPDVCHRTIDSGTGGVVGDLVLAPDAVRSLDQHRIYRDQRSDQSLHRK